MDSRYFTTLLYKQLKLLKHTWWIRMDIYWLIRWIPLLIFANRNTQEILKKYWELYCSSWSFSWLFWICCLQFKIEMKGKVSHGIGDYTVVSAIRPTAAIFTMLVPATGSIYWSEGYPGTCFLFCHFLVL